MLIGFFKYYFIYLILISSAFCFLLLKAKLKRPFRLFAVLLIILFLPGLIGYLIVTNYSPWQEVETPNLIGMEIAQAEITLGSLNLKSVAGGTIYDPEVDQGLVASQRPDPGVKVKAGRLVTIFVSSGKRKVIVPNLLGRRLEQIEAVLRAKNLSLGQMNHQVTEGASPGIILEQSPLPGEEVEIMTMIDITIVTSPEAEGAETKEGGFWFW